MQLVSYHLDDLFVLTFSGEFAAHPHSPDPRLLGLPVGLRFHYSRLCDSVCIGHALFPFGYKNGTATAAREALPDFSESLCGTCVQNCLCRSVLNPSLCLLQFLPSPFNPQSH